MAQIPIYRYHLTSNSAAEKQWSEDFAEVLKRYIAGETIYVGFDPTEEPHRKGSVGKLTITNVQDLLHGGSEYQYNRYHSRQPREELDLIPENVKPENMISARIEGHITWKGRKNKIKIGWNQFIITDHDGGTEWVLVEEEPEQVVAKDRLGREIQVGDFISYVLYHFDNGHTAAGIYYGKVTKITVDGVVCAKNIKLKPTDLVADKVIKDNSLIVIMTKDLMDQLMLAKLSSL